MEGRRKFSEGDEGRSKKKESSRTHRRDDNKHANRREKRQTVHHAASQVVWKESVNPRHVRGKAVDERSMGGCLELAKGSSKDLAKEIFGASSGSQRSGHEPRARDGLTLVDSYRGS